MSQFSNNLIFVGCSLFPKLKSKKLNDFNKTALANFLEIALPSLSQWLNSNNPVSAINLKRISIKLSDYYKIPISPEILMNQNLQKYLKSTQSKTYTFQSFDQMLIADRRPIIEEIVFLLNKHLELQPIIYELLKIYDKSNY